MITDPPSPVPLRPYKLFTISNLEDLSPLDRCVAWILAMHYVPMGKRELAGAVTFIDCSREFRDKLGVSGLPVPTQVKLVSESIEMLSSLGIVVENSSMWMCAGSAHSVICAELRAAPETFTLVWAVVKGTKPSAQFKSPSIVAEGMSWWESLISNTFFERQRKGEWSPLRSSNKFLEEIFSTGQLVRRW
jgi:hypothetical protein